MLPFLRLVRLPNTLTTIADVIAGAAVARALTGRAADPTALTLAALAAMSLYAFGMILNDLVDLEKDRELHPGRPLPSGAVSPGSARAGLALTGLASLGLLALAAPLLLPIGVALLAAIVLYDAVLKGRGVASLAMGACRGLCLSLGIGLGGGFGSLGAWLPALPHPKLLVFPLTYTALIAVVTAISTWEEKGPDARRPLPLYALLAVCYLLPAGLARAPLIALPGAALLAAWVLRPGLGATPRYGLVIRNAIFTLVFYDALFCLGAEAWLDAALCAGIYPAIRWLAKAIGQAGS